MKIFEITNRQAIVVISTLLICLTIMLAVIKRTRTDPVHPKIPKLFIGTHAEMLIEVSEDVPQYQKSLN